MADFAKLEIALVQPSGWFDQLAALLGRELAPSPRRLSNSLRLATIGTLGAGLVASCHVNNELGTYIVWLLVGAGPMMSASNAIAFLIAEAITLAASVVMAGMHRRLNIRARERVRARGSRGPPQFWEEPYVLRRWRNTTDLGDKWKKRLAHWGMQRRSWNSAESVSSLPRSAVSRAR